MLNAQTDTEKIYTTKRTQLEKETAELLKVTSTADGISGIAESIPEESIEHLFHSISSFLDWIDCVIGEDHSLDHRDKWISRAFHISLLSRDCKRQAVYIGQILSNRPSSIDEFILGGVILSCAEKHLQARKYFSIALNEFLRHAGGAGMTAIFRFVYRVTRHVRMAFYEAELYRDLILLRDPKRNIHRLNRSLENLDAALTETQTFDFHSFRSNLNYGNVLAFIGLTQRALMYLTRAESLGAPPDSLHPDLIKTLTKNIRDYLNSALTKHRRIYQATPIQLPNFIFQFGDIPVNAEKETAEKEPVFYNNIIADDTDFNRIVPGSPEHHV